MAEWWILFFWSGPIGLGIFLVMLGFFIWLLAKADEVRQRSKALSRELGLEKKAE